MTLFEKKAQRLIEEAIARGELQDLPGKGKPLDLAAYFAVPEHLRIIYDILKKADVLPEELELKKELESCRDQMKKARDDTEKKKMQQEIQYLEMKYNIVRERFRRKM